MDSVGVGGGECDGEALLLDGALGEADVGGVVGGGVVSGGGVPVVGVVVGLGAGAVLFDVAVGSVVLVWVVAELVGVGGDGVVVPVLDGLFAVFLVGGGWLGHGISLPGGWGRGFLCGFRCGCFHGHIG